MQNLKIYGATFVFLSFSRFFSVGVLFDFSIHTGLLFVDRNKFILMKVQSVRKTKHHKQSGWVIFKAGTQMKVRLEIRIDQTGNPGS